MQKDPAFGTSSTRIQCGAVICSLIVSLILGLELLTSLGLAIVAYTAAWYLTALGTEIAVVPLAAFIASAQWILGPVIAYWIGDDVTKYRMYVTEADYMSFVVPALLGFIVALSWSAPRISIQWLQARILASRHIAERIVYGLILLGLLADFFADAMPGELRFVAFLVGQFKYVGTIYLIIIRSRRRWPVAIGVLLLTAISSARIGLFHDLILWSAMMFTFLCYDFRLKFGSKIVILTICVILLVGLQTIKAEYRILIGNDPDDAGITTLTLAVGEAIFGENKTYEDSTSSVRLNQGWIISAVMAHTPNFEPFANGETVIEALQDSLLPRFLVEKRQVQVSENFSRFTGLPVSGSTSFGISTVGEAWANFGHLGIVMMLAWGAAFGCAIRYAFRRAQSQPTFALWIPLIMLYAVKAETELVVAFNYMIKASIFVILIYLITWRVLKLKI